jgi:excisionase family DNA binding protein
MIDTHAILLTRDELEALVDQRIAAAVAKISVAPSELMTLMEVCDLLKLSRKTVSHYMQKDGLPHTPVANNTRVSRFKRSEVLAWWDTRQKGKR